MTITNTRSKLPTPRQAIDWGLLPHTLGIAKHVLRGSRKAIEARAWLRAYIANGGPIGDTDVFLGLYGPEKFDLCMEGENELFLDQTGINSTLAAKRSFRGGINLRAITIRPNGPTLWRAVLEENNTGSIARVWLRNFLAQGGEIETRGDFFRDDREASAFSMYHPDMVKGGRSAEVARNLIVTIGAREDRRQAKLDGADLVPDFGAFEAHQRRLARTFQVLPHVQVHGHQSGVLPESGAKMGIEELHILADLERLQADEVGW